MQLKQDQSSKTIRLSVVRCDGPKIKVLTITNTEDHIGNNIADGYYTAEEGFKALAVYFKTERNGYRAAWRKLDSMTLWQHLWQYLMNKFYKFYWGA